MLANIGDPWGRRSLKKLNAPSFQIHTARWHREATALPCWSILPPPRDPTERSGRRRPAGNRATAGGCRSLRPPRSTRGTARCRGSRCSAAAGWSRLPGSSRSTSSRGRPSCLTPAAALGGGSVRAPPSLPRDPLTSRGHAPSLNQPLTFLFFGGFFCLISNNKVWLIS